MDDGTMRSFDTGATRDTGEGKLDFEGFLSHPVLVQFAKYMNMNRVQSDGNLRDSDNWQKGIPMDAYMKSGYRHFMDWWAYHRNLKDCDRHDDIEGVGAICGLIFNAMGWLHEWLKENDPVDFDGKEPTFEMKERLDQIKRDHNVDEPNELPDFKCTDFDRCYDCPAFQEGNEQECLEAQAQEPDPDYVVMPCAHDPLGTRPEEYCPECAADYAKMAQEYLTPKPPCFSCDWFCLNCNEGEVCAEFQCDNCGYLGDCIKEKGE